MDDFDRKIIGELAADGRISFRDLSARIHLSPNATADRVRRLQKVGVIRAFRVDFDRALLGYTVEAFIDVKMQPQTTANNFEAALRRIKGVVSAAIITGEFDFRVRVACKDQSDLVRLIESLRTQAGVQQTSSAVICREFEINNAVSGG